MARFYALLSVVSLVLCIYCVIRAITTPDNEVRYLPKIVWVLLILFFPLVGSIAWLAVGTERIQPATRTSGFPEYDRPGRAVGATPESDEEFLRRVRERADEQRRRAAEQKKRDEGQEGAGEATPPPAGS